MRVWRNLLLVSLLFVPGLSVLADNGRTECGAVLGNPDVSDTIYVLCQSLSGKSKAEVHDLIESVLDKDPRHAHETHIVFVSDPSVLDGGGWDRGLEERLASWGDAFIGIYDSNSGLLMYRSTSDGEWRKLQLGIS